MTSPKIPRNCAHCSKPFLAFGYQIRAGQGRFCSHGCAATLQWANYTPKPKPQREPRIKPSPSERFWSKVQKSNDCWVWTGRKTKFGYGMASIKRRRIDTHRLSWEMHNGLIPKGMCVLHKCDNPPCVRPDHLFLGTQKDNVNDMVQKERATSSLCAKDVREIRALYAGGGVTMKAIGAQFGIHKGTVRGIIKRLRWAHII